MYTNHVLGSVPRRKHLNSYHRGALHEVTTKLVASPQATISILGHSMNAVVVFERMRLLTLAIAESQFRHTRRVLRVPTRGCPLRRTGTRLVPCQQPVGYKPAGSRHQPP